MKFLTLILLSIALSLEASLTTIPLVFLLLLCLMIKFKENWLFIFGFVFGLLLDLAGFRTLGLSSTFFVIFLFLVLLYQSKFEIATKTFVFFASLIGSFAYLFIAKNTDSIIIETLISTIIALIIFEIFKRYDQAQIKN